MRMFALVSLVTTIEHNLFRIDRLWDVAVSHLNCVINHKNASIRQYGMECLTRLAIQALAFCGNPKNIIGGSGDPPAELLAATHPTTGRRRIFHKPQKSKDFLGTPRNSSADSQTIDISVVSPAVGEAKADSGEVLGSFKDDFSNSGERLCSMIRKGSFLVRFLARSLGVETERRRCYARCRSPEVVPNKVKDHVQIFTNVLKNTFLRALEVTYILPPEALDE